MLDRIMIDGLSFALPLFLMAMGGIYSERSGIINLALEGFQGVGAFGGALAATFLRLGLFGDSSVPYYGAMVFAMIGGMVYAIIYGLLCIKFRANQVMCGVAMNVFAMAFTEVLTREINRKILGTDSDTFFLNLPERWNIPGLSAIPVVGAVFRDIDYFKVMMVVVTIIFLYVFCCTAYGMHLRACGDNPHAAEGAGIDVGKVRFMAVMISGALSGLAGMCFAYRVFTKYTSSIYAGFGYLSIAAFIVGKWKMVPTLIACVVFGVVRSGGYEVAQLLELSDSYSELVMVFPYVLTLFLQIFFSKDNKAPRALGEIYNQEKN